MFVYSLFEDAADQIRLLSVHNGGWDYDVHCDLEAYAISTAPSWSAISYTWGHAESLSAIFVNGKKLMVRQNCLYALKQLRTRNEGMGYIWLDAICINQEDIAEKSSQVAMMGDIYESVDCVLCRIGPLIDGANCVLDVAEEMEQMRAVPDYTLYYCRVCIPEQAETGLCCCSAEHVWLEAVALCDFQTFIEAFLKFAKIEYWTRVWIMQEVIIAHDIRVLCGHREVGFSSIDSFHDMFDTLFMIHRNYPKLVEVLRTAGLFFRSGRSTHEMKQNAFSRMCSFKTKWYPGQLRLKLHLPELHHMRCSDARDRIFGLLRLLHWAEWCLVCYDWNR